MATYVSPFPDVGKLKREQTLERQKNLQTLITQLTPKNARAGAQIGTILGASFGSGLGNALADKLDPNPDIAHAQQLDQAVKDADAGFKEDPSLTPGQNQVNYLESVRTHASHLMTAQETLSLSAQIAAFRNDAFNQSRLTAQDGRAATKEQRDAKMAELQYNIHDLSYQQSMKVAKDGLVANQWVFQMPDGSVVTAGQGGDLYTTLMEAKNDPQSEIKLLGDYNSLNKLDMQKQLEDYKAGIKERAPAKPFKFQKSSLDAYDELNSMANLLDTIDHSPKERSGGAQNIGDRVQDIGNKIAPSLIDPSPTFALKGNYDKVRGAMQSLIKGVPSNNDQYIYDLSNPSIWESPQVNEVRLQMIREDVKQRARSAYANAMTMKSKDQEVPRAIVEAMVKLGVDVSDIGTPEEEKSKLEAITARNTATTNAIVTSSGHTPGEKYDVSADPAPAKQPATTKSGIVIK